MNFEGLLAIYERWKSQYKEDTPRYISAILREAKDAHYRDWQIQPTAGNSHEDSWRAFKGKNLEKLIMHIIKEEVESLGLNIVHGGKLERTLPKNLSDTLNKVQRNLAVRYVIDGETSLHLPDVDIVIYDPLTASVIAVVSSKVTLRERIAQTGYWKLKLSADSITRPIRIFFITPDEDGTLTKKSPMKKGRAIAEVDTDGAYVMTEAEVEASNKVKSFDRFVDDLRTLLRARLPS